MTATQVLVTTGTWRKIGSAYGEEFRDRIRDARDAVEQLVGQTGITREGLQERLAAYAAWAERALPDRWEELLGVADGSHLLPHDVLLMHLLEDIFEVDACTSAGAGNTLLHAEMWFAEQNDYAVLVATPPQGPTVITVSCIGFLTGVGLNSAGFAVGVQSTSSTDHRIGVPRALVSRHALCAPTIAAMTTRTQQSHRSGGNGYVVVSAGSVHVIETSADHAHITDPLPRGAHTNHYLAESMQAVATRAGESATRYRNANREISDTSSSLSHEQARRILASPGFRTASETANVATAFVLFADVTEQRVHVSTGNGDDGHWTTVGMDGFTSSVHTEPTQAAAGSTAI